MKKVIFVLVITIVLVACKKETTTPNVTTINNKKVDSSNTANDSIFTFSQLDSIDCVENKEINFSSKVNPIGIFAPCIMDIDGNIYKTVIIGKQRWMAENLKVTRYNDGTFLHDLKDSLSWANSGLDGWCYYNNDKQLNSKYGKLYNGSVIISLKNVCPIGWSVPSYSDWQLLALTLGGDTIASAKMKEIGVTSWKEFDVNSTNNSLFSAIPAGIRSPSADGFYYIGEYAQWWGDDSNNKIPNVAIVNNEKQLFIAPDYLQNVGCSIRCIKD